MRPKTHNQQVIIRKLNITHLQYCEMVEAGGYIWLQRYLSHVPEVISLSSYSQLWWKWWVNEWNIRDHQFVLDVRFRKLPDDVIRKYYDDVHKINTLIIRPNRWVIKEVDTLIKQHINNQLQIQ
jgi:hypothetical protein